MSRDFEAARMQYHTDGYVVLSGLIPPEVVAAARARVEAHLAETGKHVHFFPDPEITACTEAFREAAMVLAGGDPTTFRTHQGGLAIHSLPTGGEWTMPTPHIDGALKHDDNPVVPPPFRIATMTYLTDVVKYGGGTVVWAGSPAQIEAVYNADPVRFAKMYDLNEALAKGEIPLDPPVELTPKAGDVLFYQCLCAHAGSMNIQKTPRLAFNCKW
jgi:hypothetical protein